ncbi:MAG: YqjF family protein [Jatrophihabitans sp.]
MPIHEVAPQLSGPTLSAQHWDNLTFLHWPVEPAAIAGLFPPGVRPDVIDGLSYVGLVPFQMRGAGPGRLATPYFGQFCETNVRLYSVDTEDRHGIVFLTLDAARLATVLLARLSLALPYAWSAMSAHRDGEIVSYRSIRRWPDRHRRAGGTIRVRIGAPARAEPVETWLTARWGLHTRVAGRTLWVPNQHGSWPLHQAEVLDLDSDLVQACGVDIDPARRLRALWSPGVSTTFGLPSRVRS